MYTPADVLHGRTVELSGVRADVLAGAYAAHASLIFDHRCLTGLDRFRNVPSRRAISTTVPLPMDG